MTLTIIRGPVAIPHNQLLPNAGMVFLEVRAEDRRQSVIVASCALDDLGGIGPDEIRTEARTLEIVTEHQRVILQAIANKIAADEVDADGTVYVRPEDIFPRLVPVTPSRL